jgi:hypothetical protein
MYEVALSSRFNNPKNVIVISIHFPACGSREIFNVVLIGMRVFKHAVSSN